MSARSSQDLLMRTCAAQDHAKTSDRISSGSPPHLLTRTSLQDRGQNPDTSSTPQIPANCAMKRLQVVTEGPARDSPGLCTRVAQNQQKITPRRSESNPTLASSTEKVARAISHFAPRHNGSDPTPTKSREGCGRVSATSVEVYNAKHCACHSFEANRCPHFVRASAVETHMDI